MRSKEIEFKYHAQSLEIFHEFCKQRKPKDVKTVWGTDDFYSRENDLRSFFRYRSGTDGKQLTLKVKTHDVDNYIRDEHNFDLKDETTKESIDNFCQSLGYKYNSSISKLCHIYNYGDHTIVYYICYGKNQQETGRYVEIEMSESYPWSDEKEAFNSLIILEKLCKPIGASPSNRIKESLFELNRKEAIK